MQRTLTAVIASCFLVLAMSLIFADLADAARMGGGRSFGGSSGMSMPYGGSTQTARPYTTQQQATTAGAGAATVAGTGMGAGAGLFGGLLAGTMLGSMLGGGAAGEGGSGFMDIILMLLVFWLVMSFIRKRRMAQQPQQYQQYQQYQQSQAGGYGAQTMAGSVPADFDTEGFLKGAKMAYTRMQASWDKRDLEDISHFATDAIMRELARQNAEDPNPGRTEIVGLNATVVNVDQLGSMDRAQVLFDALLIEDPRQTRPSSVREIWTFIREHNTGSWKLDYIQQA